MDLTASGVVLSTNELWAGDNVVISWTGQNISRTPLESGWTDAVYLSQADRWSIDDQLLALVPHTGGLGSNEVYSAQAPVTVPSLLPGDYYIIVRSDCLNEVTEEREDNNFAVFGPVSLRLPSLALNGAMTSGVITTNNRVQSYVVQLAPGECLRLTLDGLGISGNIGLYASRGALPTTWQSDVHSAAPGQDQQLVLTGPAEGGGYYISVYGLQISTSNPYELKAETGALFAAGVNPAWVGNTAATTVTLTGAGFDAATTVEFINGQGLVRTPASIEFVSSGVLRLTLDARDWPTGPYDLRVTKGTSTAELTRACTILEGGEQRLDVRLKPPSVMTFGMATRQSIWIEYTNSGNVAIPAPLFTLSGDNTARLSGDPDQPVPRQRYGSIPGISATALLLGSGSREAPALLQPGESGRIPAYFLGTSKDIHDGTPAGAPPITFTLSTLPTVDSRPIDWAQISSLDQARWSHLRAMVGYSVESPGKGRRNLGGLPRLARG